jgi:hypothetical protein
LRTTLSTGTSKIFIRLLHSDGKQVTGVEQTRSEPFSDTSGSGSGYQKGKELGISHSELFGNIAKVYRKVSRPFRRFVKIMGNLDAAILTVTHSTTRPLPLHRSVL